jgi:pyruvyl transferase EpsI
MLRIIDRLRFTNYAKKVPFGWKLKLQYLLSKKNSYPLISKNEMKIFVAIAADYGNLGDIAITHAQINFLRGHFPNYKIVILYVKDFYMLTTLKRSINSTDIITTIGGGNMGDLYEGLEDRRRYIIDLFPNNKIISFPQSIDFKRKKSLKKSIKVYSKHQDLHIFAREPQSYKYMKESFKNNNVYLVPDIVLNLNKMEPKLNREGIILCLRNDLEKKISNNQKDSLVLSIKKRYQKVDYYDTFINNFLIEFEEKELENIWLAFKKSKVVVTDRLHGMIFCAITKTPCVVLPNSNHKIASTYDKWLANLNYIIFVENFDEKILLDYIDTLYNIKTDEEFISLDLSNKYESLLDALKI